MDAFGLTERGSGHHRNEDQFLIATLKKSLLVQRTSIGIENPTSLIGNLEGHLLVVADGMGGHERGDVASSAAMAALLRYVVNTLPWFYGLHHDDDDDLVEQLERALVCCQRDVEELSQANPGGKGMRTTLTMGYVLWPRLYVVHVGDSLCCLLRDSKLHKLTIDHTFAQSLVSEGRLSADEAKRSRWNKILFKSLGGRETVIPDVYRIDLQPSDSLLLATNGLFERLDQEGVAGVLANGDGAEEQCAELVRCAQQAGASDDVTVVVAHFSEEPARVPQAAAC